MRTGDEIIVVSGLPRSGTSLMMQMLDHGGVETITDQIRVPDVDNPKGYYEFEKVKQVKNDASWLPETRGKAFKMVSLLLFDLPKNEKYLVIFMERDIDEMLISQEKMLERLNRPAAPREDIKRGFTAHLQKLHAWVEEQTHLDVLRIKYSELLADPNREAARIAEFLGRDLDLSKMAETVDPQLYRNRKS